MSADSRWGRVPGVQGNSGVRAVVEAQGLVQIRAGFCIGFKVGQCLVLGVQF